PRISKTMLSERLQELIAIGAVERHDGTSGPEYELTASGKGISSVVMALGTWGQRFLPRQSEKENLDAEPLFVDMQRRVRSDALPARPIVVRFEIDGMKRRFLLLKASEISFCLVNPGFPEPLLVRAKLPVLVAWWRQLHRSETAGARAFWKARSGPCVSDMVRSVSFRGCIVGRRQFLAALGADDRSIRLVN
ncbi:MAG TPA: winged helix-turn-helix transcriptional regulator, partial [Bradyrhizobium sp.]|nr:winged helix-turn-helix transcriptional regulator [Bradyrhizobium sp.]